ncbi:MAG: ChuX/HutX family heme-like substrate-binding protein [Lentilitoribacter sp.]
MQETNCETAADTAVEIREFCANNPKMRERDIANMLEIKEAQLVAAHVGYGNTRLICDIGKIFSGLADVGEVLALTRNESAVHEKTGIYDAYYAGKFASMVSNEQIDLRLFPKHFAHAFWIKKETEHGTKQSIQFFDAQGDAVHKIHTKPKTDMKAWSELVEQLYHHDQSEVIEIDPDLVKKTIDNPESVADKLKDRWSKMTDTHQFTLMIKNLNLSRHQAVNTIGDEYAWPIDLSSIEALMGLAANEQLPIMCFIGNKGCIQIHSGPIQSIKRMGNWLNILDEGFHMHLRADHIDQVWAVRKPTDKGHVSSVEAYDAAGNLIIQFFGKRIEGQDERNSWRLIVENLPRIKSTKAA